ncbi:hypothetical protein ACET3Z_019314 [Daucus carota]
MAQKLGNGSGPIQLQLYCLFHHCFAPAGNRTWVCTVAGSRTPFFTAADQLTRFLFQDQFNHNGFIY